MRDLLLFSCQNLMKIQILFYFDYTFFRQIRNLLSEITANCSKANTIKEQEL